MLTAPWLLPRTQSTDMEMVSIFSSNSRQKSRSVYLLKCQTLLEMINMNMVKLMCFYKKKQKMISSNYVAAVSGGGVT